MDVNLLHLVILRIRIVNAIGASKNPQSLPGKFRRRDCGAMSRCEDDFGRDYGTAAKKSRLFTAETDLKGKVRYIRQIAMNNFPPLAVIVGKLRMNYK